jgi:DNA-binding MarR family transcriptional regulator
VAAPKPLSRDPIGEARDHWVRAGWDEAAGGMVAVTSIIRVQQLVLGDIDRVLRPLGLTFARYEVLMLLHFSRRGALPVGKIGARLQVHPASVTNAVDRLEHDGFVVRTANPDDRRGVIASLTDDGRTCALEATERLNPVFEAFPLDPDELDVLADALRTVRKAFGDFR